MRTLAPIINRWQLLLILLTSNVATAYDTNFIYTFNGEALRNYFGRSVSNAGDVNNDGYDDVIVGAPGNSTNGTQSGSAQIFSGVDGNIIYTFYGHNTEDNFGISVSSAGDINHDGYDDVIVGVYRADNNGDYSGSAQIFSGIDGNIIYTFNGDNPGDGLGFSVSQAGDVNNDSYPDVIVGIHGDDNNGQDSGSARVFSGADGSILYTFDGDSPRDEFGGAVSSAGDVNNDGYDDVIVGATHDGNVVANSGSARVFSGSDGSILYTFNGNSVSNDFGISVSGAGDINHDGYDDVMVGATGDDNNGLNSGSARVFSGMDGSILYIFNGDNSENRFGRSVKNAGDVNNDGYDDLIVGADFDDDNGSNSGSAQVFSGIDGSILYTFSGDNTDDHFGYSVSSAGDINNDGYADVIVGAHWNNNGGKNSGLARVFSGKGLWVDTDNDSINNTVDEDDDNDGYIDTADLFPLDSNRAGDIDGDNIESFVDNCVFIANSNQTDSDNDGQGDFCDTDDDNDNTPDTIDSFPYDPNRSAGNSNILYTFNGESANDRFGNSVSTAGDVNNDGYDDVIIGSYQEDNNGSNSGSARIFSGLNGDVIYLFNGDSAGDYFGSAVDCAGDVNNDGYDDVIVGAPMDNNNGNYAGSAKIFSGADGGILYVFHGDDSGDNFGASVSTAGDVNQDGYPDVIVGAPSDDNNGISSGSARIFSGRDGSILNTFYGDDGYDYFGYSVSDAGDINHDGYGDVIIGAKGDNNGIDPGSVQIYSGFDGSRLYLFSGNDAKDYFFSNVDNARDVNNDGYDDVIVGACESDNNGENAGSAQILSGADGHILYIFNGDSVSDYFCSVGHAGDVNNDGYDDVIIGAYQDDNNGSNSGSARVLSGKDGSILYVFNGDNTNDNFGTVVSHAGDLNNDGYADLIVGALHDDNNGSNSGSARIFSGKGLWTDTDNDSQNDAIDSDDDNDGVLDINDLMPLLFIDTDNDNISDFLDWDDDNDGVLDTIDAAPLDNSNTSEITLPLDGVYKGIKVLKQESQP